MYVLDDGCETLDFNVHKATTLGEIPFYIQLVFIHLQGTEQLAQSRRRYGMRILPRLRNGIRVYGFHKSKVPKDLEETRRLDIVERGRLLIATRMIVAYHAEVTGTMGASIPIVNYTVVSYSSCNDAESHVHQRSRPPTLLEPNLQPLQRHLDGSSRAIERHHRRITDRNEDWDHRTSCLFLGYCSS